MDFTNHPYRRSYIDNRLSTSKVANSSIIDSYTTKLRIILRDETLDSRFVAKCIHNLSEADINDFADYAVRKGDNPGRAFVGLANKAMQYKTI